MGTRSYIIITCDNKVEENIPYICTNFDGHQFGYILYDFFQNEKPVKDIFRILPHLAHYLWGKHETYKIFEKELRDIDTYDFDGDEYTINFNTETQEWEWGILYYDHEREEIIDLSTPEQLKDWADKCRNEYAQFIEEHKK